MDKFSVDYSDLQSKLAKKKAFLLSDVKHEIRKVAFDVVRFIDGDKIDGLWQIQSDGENEYIVAMYDEDQPTTKTASATPWSALADKSGANITVFYNNAPIKRICIASLGISSEDAYLVCNSLKDKLSNDESFLTSFKSDLDKDALKTIENS